MSNNNPQDFVTPPRAPIPGVATVQQQPAAARKKAPRAKSQGRSGPRSLGLQRTLFALVGVVVLLLVVLVTTQKAKVTYVVRLKSEVPAMSTIDRAQLSADPVDAKSIEPGTFSGEDAKAALDAAVKAVTGMRTVVPLVTNQQLRGAYLTASVQLEADERLLSVSADAARAVAGTIKAGDRLDVYVATADGRSFLLDSDVEVVALSVSGDQLAAASQQQTSDRSKQAADLLPANPIPGAYILRVKVANSATYIAGDAAGQLSLVLRGANAGVTPPASASIAELANQAQATCAATPDKCTTP